ncbi:hypothetical protein [Variovorax paradoxus]|uniref:hypothetical protein n=1 Tax=Variovorax paradoxus TaxID=34073 RepID=UPI0029C77A4A|nr:hypothetical protein [Variovorax paradoxus]WPH22273.1 hypothetical protein RZE78_08945 [Variovorax paradoxus]
MGKQTRNAGELRKLLLERIEAIPELAGQLTDVHRGGVVWKDPGEGGPNWTVPILSDRGTHRPDIARIIRQAQMEFDLEAD